MRNPDNQTEGTQSGNRLVTRLDVLDPASIEQAVEESIRTFGKIDVLVNNAGYGAYGPLESFTKERIVRQFNTNVIGLLDVTKAVLPHFRRNKGGIIINISSMGGKLTFPLGALYHGTKFAVEGISESLSYEVEQFGGKVKVIEPGAIATDFAGRSLDFSNDESLAEYQPLIGKVMTAMPVLYQQAAPATAIAEVIYEAATDGTHQLRYTAGADAQAMIATRRQLDDDSFREILSTQFGL